MTEEKRNPWRPSKYEPRFCDMIVEHMAEGASMTSFAAEINVARSTLNKWMEEHPDFSEAVKQGKAKCAAWWEKLGRMGAMGGEVNPTLVIFGLKNMAADDWRDKQEVVQTNLNVPVVSADMSPEEAARAYQDLMNASG